MPLNIVCFVCLAVDVVFKAVCIKPKFNKNSDYYKPMKLAKFYLIKRMLIVDVIFLLIFVLSYVLAYSVSRFFRLIILVKLF